MGKRRGGPRKVPLGGWRPMTSLREARRVTSKFHAYTRELEALRKPGGKASEGGKREAELRELLAGIGGRERYQEASMLLTSQNSSSAKWVFQNVTRMGMRPSKGQPPLRTLEVGAINTQLLSCPYLAVRAIDIQSRNPRIEQRDFFDVDPSREPPYKVLSNAMVINCVPTPELRGEMLLRCFKLLEPDGFLSLVLPRRCVESITEARLLGVLNRLGFRCEHRSESPKIAFFALIKNRTCWHRIGGGGAEEDAALCSKLNGNGKAARADQRFDVRFETEMLSRFCCCGSGSGSGSGSETSRPCV